MRKLYCNSHARLAAAALGPMSPQVFVTTPFQIICALCFAWTLYGMAGMRHGGEFIAKWGCVVTLVYLISVQVLHACAIAAPNQDTAFMMSIVWTTVQMLVSTFFVNFSEVGGCASEQCGFVVSA
jgi:hypothetical protein